MGHRSRRNQRTQVEQLLGGIGFGLQATEGTRRRVTFTDDLDVAGGLPRTARRGVTTVGSQGRRRGQLAEGGLAGTTGTAGVDRAFSLASVPGGGAIPRQKLSPGGTVLTGPGGVVPRRRRRVPFPFGGVN